MEKILKKPIDEYTVDEKSALLKFWWYYYGKVMISLKEWETFNKLVETNLDDVLTVAVIALMYNKSSQDIISAMRKNKLDTLFRRAQKIRTKLERKGKFDILLNRFFTLVVEAYNNPEPNIPMDDGEIEEQISQVVGTEKKFEIVKINLH